MFYGLDQVFCVGSSIIFGVGFLCSGVIFKDRGIVCGMNIVVILWCIVVIGIFVSMGMYVMVIIVVIILIGFNLILCFFVRKFYLIIFSDEFEKQYCILVICQEKVEQDICLLLINSNFCKMFFLNNLESGDVVGDKVEIVVEYCFVGKFKNNILEGIVGQVLVILEVISVGWEVL